jgi:hypothetical protein
MLLASPPRATASRKPAQITHSHLSLIVWAGQMSTISKIPIYKCYVLASRGFLFEKISRNPDK